VAYITSILKAKIIWYWADPLPNLNNYIYQGVKLTDLLVSYSRSSLPAFQSMGAPRTCWVPFGADLDTHNTSKTPLALEYDLSFVGSWRPEREKVLSIIHRNFPELKIRVDGPYWNRCEYNGIRRIANSKPIYGSEFSTIVQQSLISLNVTDTTNFPSANMRFFEIMASGGTQLVSDSDEMKDTFLDKEHVLYFNDEHSLLEKLKFALGNKDEMMRIRSNAYKEVSGNHLYIHRLKEILKYE
jgi:spore maturation protein CgeB